MTTNANKFGLRKAHEERVNRHAQRTPLPPRPEKLAEAAEAIADAKAVMASDNGKSIRKAVQFRDEATTRGWTANVGEADEGMVEVVVTRGGEIVHQAWINGVWQYDASTYTIGDRTTKPRNASAAKKLLDRTPEEAEAELSKVASNTFFKRRTPNEDGTAPVAGTRRKGKLPFTLADDDETVIQALQGRTIKWVNRLSNTVEEATSNGTRFVRLTQVGEERVYQFCEHRGQGFRAFRLSDVVRVR